MSAPQPDRAAVVIIGGGVMGLSTAQHLARAGVEDVVLVERGALGEGSTCKAAGGVRSLFSDRVNIAIGLRSLEMFERFGIEMDTEIDLHQVGYLFLIDDADHEAALAGAVELQNSFGVPSRMIGPEEAKRLSPLIDTTGIRSAVWSPRDGHCTPESVVLGYATAARRHGVQILTGCEVTGIATEDGVITGVHTSTGTLDTSVVICAAGAWSRDIARSAGVDLPVSPLRRQVAITEPIAGIDPRTPFTVDFSSSFYFHREGEGLLLGMAEESDAWGFDLSRSSEWLETLAGAMERRLPSLGDVGIQSGWAGLYEMTPDHNALIGESGEVSRFLYATGFSGHGFLMGPAVGEIICDLYLGEAPSIDVSSLAADRFAAASPRPELNIV
ncbi:NAD(P)/FAD-dependent oxidoreductase [Aeromicrobium sp. CF3.5]|uniref:NAD(P)/FAD-dependent oxidoreductase n=1 Tax=Aeromicrobium sp. CF3.5 TaxID=3373078 RepID=UPI003EE62941